MPRLAHLVGSVGLEDVEEVFRVAGLLLGPSLKHIPDGEPGGRRVWTSWQYPVLLANPFLQTDEAAPIPARGPGFRRFRLADGCGPENIRFGELGYAREARASYQDFLEARIRSEVAATTRFQVCLPTPINVVGTQCAADAVLAVEPAYEAAMRREIEAICRAIPHEDLCIQLDMVREIIWWDGRLLQQQPAPFVDIEHEVASRLRRICSAIPSAVELGFHICYGDWGGRHHIQPLDAAKMAELANAVTANVARPVNYFHMPVPIDRDDDRYFVPLQNLKLSAETDLYLGLLHVSDGIEGAKRRIATASKYIQNFGIATECGLGRAKTADTVKTILELYASAAALD
jgi:hypothetical protein